MAVAELSTTGNDRIHPGANMSPFELIVGEIEAFYDEAKNWADGVPITDQAQHDEVEKLHDALHNAGQEAEALRVAEKDPLDQQVKAIQAKYHPLIGDTKAGKGKVILGKAALNTMLTAWRKKVADDKAAAALKARQEADALLAEATEAIRASAGNLEAREQAEETLSFAKEATKFAARTEKAATTGLGLRTTYDPVLTDLSAAIKHYWAIPARREGFAAAVMLMAIDDVRAGKRDAEGAPGIPGFKIQPSQKAL